MPSKKRVAFMVDGKCERALEQKLDKTNHEYFFLKREKNGRDVTLNAIAKECVSILKVANSLYHIVIIIIDKEERAGKTATNIEVDLVTLISNEHKGKFDLVVTDMMFENWILSDIDNVSSKHPTLLTKTSNSSSFESTHGSGKLDDMWLRGNDGAKYSSDKISNSKKLFKYVQPSVGVTHSASFKKFMNVLNKHDIKIY